MQRFTKKHQLNAAIKHLTKTTQKTFQLTTTPKLEFDDTEQQIYLVFEAPGTPAENAMRYEAVFKDLLDSEHAHAIRHVGLQYASTSLQPTPVVASGGTTPDKPVHAQQVIQAFENMGVPPEERNPVREQIRQLENQYWAAVGAAYENLVASITGFDLPVGTPIRVYVRDYEKHEYNLISTVTTAPLVLDSDHEGGYFIRVPTALSKHPVALHNVVFPGEKPTPGR